MGGRRVLWQQHSQSRAPVEEGHEVPMQATHHHVVRIRNFSFKLEFSTLVVTLIYQKHKTKQK